MGHSTFSNVAERRSLPFGDGAEGGGGLRFVGGGGAVGVAGGTVDIGEGDERGVRIGKDRFERRHVLARGIARFAWRARPLAPIEEARIQRTDAHGMLPARIATQGREGVGRTLQAPPQVRQRPEQPRAEVVPIQHGFALLLTTPRPVRFAEKKAAEKRDHEREHRDEEHERTPSGNSRRRDRPAARNHAGAR